MLQPVKVAFGQYMGRFYASLIPTTKVLHEYVARGLDKSVVWAPSRMVDAVEDMIASWQKNDSNTSTQPAKMPVVIVAMAEDYVPSGRDFTRQIPELPHIIIPQDGKNRAFKVQVVAGDIRAQIVFAAHDEPTAKSMAAQFLLFADSIDNRRFDAAYSFAGMNDHLWPVQIESTDSPAISIKSDVKNMTILAVDLTLKASIPIFRAPAINEPNDGKGTPGDSDDPSGYPVVEHTNITKEDTI